MPRIAMNSRRSRTSCSIIALATVMAVGATPAAGESFQGAGNFITNGAGVANINQAVANLTTVTLNPGNTIINWTPTDTAINPGVGINFQNAGTTANFISSGSFAVLNRILPTDVSRVINMNGTINGIAGGNTGGSIYFYAPSGFVFGGSSLVNVSSLVVSALPISDASFAGAGSNGFGSVTFGQATNPTATITMAGTVNAFIPALGFGGATGPGYVALVAPKVAQVSSSTFNVNGSTALVAAEAATINFSPDGLFDIQVTAGTTDSIGVSVNGNIGGETPTGVADKQGIYLVAVPKNQLLTMVIGSGADLGFTLAGSAAIDNNGVVILSAGHDIVDGAIGAKSTGHGSGTASLWFTGAHATNNLIAEATGYADLYSTDAQASQMITTFDSSVTAHAVEHVTMNADGFGSTLTVGGNVNLSTDLTGAAGQSVTAGAVQLSGWNGGAVSIAGSTNLSANATGGNASSGTAGSGTGGNVSVNVSNGSTLSLHNLTTSAIGTGGSGLLAGVNSGTGQGGGIGVTAQNLGSAITIALSSPLVLDAQGYGGNASGAGLAAGGIGGVAQFDVFDNASLTINGGVRLLANGTGGGSEMQGGSGIGGIANIGSDAGPGGGSTLTINGNTEVIADGQGGNATGVGGVGGNASGGDAFVGASANTFNFNGNLTISAAAVAGNASSGTGGDAVGGVAGLVGSGAGIHVTNIAEVDASAEGGDGDFGGSGDGGYARIQGRNIVVDSSAFVTAHGSGGFGESGSGGNGSGGTVDVLAQGGLLDFNSALFGRADGLGGGSQLGGSTSGNGSGGSTNILAQANGTIDVTGGLQATADGFGGGIFGFGVNGGDGTGGSAFVQASGANAHLSTGAEIFVSANGLAGEACIECGGSGLGGDGTGGDVRIQAFGAPTATMSIGGNVNAEANGEGGNGFSGAAGDGTGGNVDNGGGIIVGVNDGANLHIDGALYASAEGEGGYSYGSGNGGRGEGGDINVYAATAGTLTIDGGGYLDADGYGGSAGILASGNGGDGQGGIIHVQAAVGGAIDLGFALEASADGEGGFSDNAVGGDGTGGTVQIHASDGGTIDVDGILASADGFGGDDYGYGGDLDVVAGNGMGGFVELFTFGSGAPDINVFGNVDLHADGYGGDNDGQGPVTLAGNGSGGTAWFDAQAGTIDIGGNVIVTATGTGGVAEFGTGGNGTGKNAEIDGIGGVVTIGGTALVDVSGVGGDGQIAGGDGIGGGVLLDDGDFIDGAFIFAQNGSVSIAGTATLKADGTGGAGLSGAFETPGGSGGNATGGLSAVHASNSNLGPSSISLSTVNISANATGGAGGQGGGGTAGGNGGAGGNALAGSTLILANAGNGHVTTGVVNATAIALGGQGGDGGNGDGQGGGNGGAGGNAEGGFVEIGTASGNPNQAGASNLGTAVYASINADSSATGGDGGAGSFGNPDGNGGAGGIGDGGRSVLLVRGSQVTVNGTTTLTSNGTGGDGGLGGGEFGTQGVGGDGFAGELGVTATSRFQHIDQTGTLTTGAIIGTAAGVGGDGSTDGSGIVEGGSGVFIDRSTAHIASLDFTISGAEVTDGADPSQIAIANVPPANVEETVGTVLVDGTFTFSTPGELSFIIDNANLSAGALVLTAGNFVTDTNAPPANRGTAFADSATITTGGDFIADADFDIDSNLTITAPGLIDAHNFNIDGDLSLTATSGGIDVGDLLATGSVSLIAGGNIMAGDIAAGENIGLATPGTMTTGDIEAGGLFMALGHGDMIFGDATANEIFLSDFAVVPFSSLTATCVGSCGTLGANGVVTAPPSGPTYSYVTTEGGEDGAGQLPGEGGTNGSLYTTSEFTVAAGEALDFWFNYVTSDGSGFADYAWAGLFTPSLDPVAILFTARTQPSGTIVPGLDLPGVEATLNPSSVPIIDGAPVWSPLGANSGSCYDAGCGFTGWVNSTYDIADAGSYILQFGVTNWTDNGFQSGMAFSGLSIGGVAVTPVLLTRTGGSITIGDVETGKFNAAAGTSLTTGIISSSGSMALDAGGAITTGNLFAGNFVLANGGSITTGTIDADSVDMASTGGNITVNGDITALNDVALDAFGDIVAQDITAGSIDLLAGDDITTGDLTTQQLVLLDFGDQITTLLFPGASITLESGGDILTGDISSIDGVFADAGGSLTTGMIDAVDFVELQALNNILTLDITAGDYLRVTSFAGAIDTGDLTGGDIELEAAGAIAFDDVDGYDFDFSAGGSVTGNNIVVTQKAQGDAGGSVTLGNITAGPFVPFDDFSVGIAAIGNITVQNVSGAGHVGFVSQGNLQTGNLTAGDLVMTLVGGNTTTGATTTNDEFGQVYMADDSMFFTGGGTIEGGDDFDESIVLGLDPVATGGSITVNGAVDTNLFRAAAGTSLTTQDIFANEIEASAGGTATLNGIWHFTDFATLESNDINITATGGIDGDTTGEIALISSNPTQMLIGDGIAGTGYALSNAEFGRLSGADVAIVGRGNASAAIDMLIGDLTVTGPTAGSTIENSEGVLAFAVGDFDTESVNGVIRVVGDVSATGFGSGNAIEFYADRFELDAATGSVSIFSSGTTLGGELGLYADRIHVADGTILNQLAANPTYTNYQQDLNKAATVQRPEGVLLADTLWIESENLQDILIQNTGTTAAPAGFLVRQAFINDDFEVAGPAGSINLVVNGQVVTEGGTLTGVAARDALVTPEDDITPFTANSTINGCPLTGPCIIRPPEPPPVANVVDNQIDLINENPLGDGEFGNEDSIDDNEDGDEGANNPITPPQPLFDTRPLIPSSDVDDPVSGTGNPALLGGGECVDDDDNQCGTKKEGDQ